MIVSNAFKLQFDAAQTLEETPSGPSPLYTSYAEGHSPDERIELSDRLEPGAG